MRKRVTLPVKTEINQRQVDRLRSDARYAFLDGRNAHARRFNKQADLIERKLQKSGHGRPQ